MLLRAAAACAAGLWLAAGAARGQLPALRVSPANPHLVETVTGTPVFLNNYTAWAWVQAGTREDAVDLMGILKRYNYNMASIVLLGAGGNDGWPQNGQFSAYGSQAFENGAGGNPDPTRPIVTAGSDPAVPGQYDYWDHADYFIDTAAANGVYVSLHPCWGDWVAGGYNGETAGQHIIFDATNAYQYGQWLGERYGQKTNVLWMLGGDRSAVYGSLDYRSVWQAMAEGIADGASGVNNQDGAADYGTTLISYHPRKWAPNSSAWFHGDAWLDFNSIQDTPGDQVASMPNDYNLSPTKPAWLFEGRYEDTGGSTGTTAWAVRFQAYQTVLAGGFGHTYGNEGGYFFPATWRQATADPGFQDMAHLYTVARAIWTDAQFLDRTPDQALIVGSQGSTTGDRMTATSDRCTATRGGDGTWAIVYSASGRDVTLDLARLADGDVDAYWFNPRSGGWWAGGSEFAVPTPFLTDLATGPGKGTRLFDPPGTAGTDNDWVLVLAATTLLTPPSPPPGPGTVAPYTADANTLHLYHFDEAPGAADPGTPFADSGVGTALPFTNTGGPDGRNNTGGGGYGAAAWPGFGSALDVLAAGDGTYHAATSTVGGGVRTAAAVAQSSLQGADGAFTYEAIIRISDLGSSEQNILSHDGASVRGFCLQIVAGELLFVAVPGSTTFSADIPTSGVHAFDADEWFHVAVTYTGDANAAGNLGLYWTRLDSGVLEANPLGFFTLAADLANVSNYLTVGTQARNPFRFELRGLVDEVRISDIARAPGDFLFLPEPATLALVALGTAIPLCRRRAAPTPRRGR